MNLGVDHIRESTGDDQTWKSSPRAEINPSARCWREGHKLERISDVAGPQLRLGRSCDKIDPLLPLLKNGDKTVESTLCFT